MVNGHMPTKKVGQVYRNQRLKNSKVECITMDRSGWNSGKSFAFKFALNFHFLNWYSSDWVTIFDSFDICHIPSSSNPDNEEPCFHREERCTGQFGPYTTITFQDRFQSRNAYNFSGIPNAQYWNRFKVESWCKKKYFPSNPFGHPGILYQ